MVVSDHQLFSTCTCINPQKIEREARDIWKWPLLIWKSDIICINTVSNMVISMLRNTMPFFKIAWQLAFFEPLNFKFLCSFRFNSFPMTLLVNFEYYHQQFSDCLHLQPLKVAWKCALFALIWHKSHTTTHLLTHNNRFSQQVEDKLEYNTFYRLKREKAQLQNVNQRIPERLLKAAQI